jgi:2-succinyl-5-enolpyruvyl-6-hydroxy-3-cyclohexene-1-carboxylate synthase
MSPLTIDRDEVKFSMGKRALKKRINSLIKRVKEHRLKIKRERMKSDPDHRLINHWEAEVKAFQKSIETAQKRLRV